MATVAIEAAIRRTAFWDFMSALSFLMDTDGYFRVDVVVCFASKSLTAALKDWTSASMSAFARAMLTLVVAFRSCTLRSMFCFGALRLVIAEASTWAPVCLALA